MGVLVDNNVLIDLKNLEPVFHHPNFGTSKSDYEKVIPDDFWEVGASGRSERTSKLIRD
jgi:hypothetical protein